eukprot:COSAG02_NODE_849_length_16548_cov_6.418384_9_plen_59_part_00
MAHVKRMGDDALEHLYQFYFSQERVFEFIASPRCACSLATLPRLILVMTASCGVQVIH